MSGIISIEVEPRPMVGTANTKRLRKGGLVPAVVYGGDNAPMPVSLDPRQIIKIMHSPGGRNSVCLLKLSGTEQSRHVLLKEIQQHPVSHAITHADFVRVDLTQRVKVKVPVRAHGEAQGVKTGGGRLEIVHHEVEIECTPENIPASIELDVSSLEIHDAIRLSDVTLAEGVSIVNDDLTQMLLHVVQPTVIEEPTAEEAAAAAETAEPEVMKKGKQDEEE